MNKRKLTVFLATVLFGPALLVLLLSRLWTVHMWLLGLFGVPEGAKIFFSFLAFLIQGVILTVGLCCEAAEKRSFLNKWLNEGE